MSSEPKKKGLTSRLFAKFSKELDVNNEEEREQAITEAVDDYWRALNETGNHSEAMQPLDELAVQFREARLPPVTIYKAAYDKNKDDLALLKFLISEYENNDELAHSKDAVEIYWALTVTEQADLTHFYRLIDYYRAHEDPNTIMRIEEQIVERAEKIKLGEIQGEYDAEANNELFELALEDLSHNYYEMGRNDDTALSIYEQQFANNPADNSALAMVATGYRDQKRKDARALDIYEKYFVLAPDDSELLKVLVDAYFEQGSPEKAIVIMEKLSGVDSEDVEILSRLVQYYRSRRMLNEASIKRFKEYAKLRPDDTDLIGSIAEYYAVHQNISLEASQYYRKALTGDIHKDHSYRNLLARHCLTIEAYEKALEVLKPLEGTHLMVGDIILCNARARANLFKTDDESARLYEQAIQLGARAPLIYNSLCLCYIRAKKLDNSAYRHFEATVDLDEDTPWGFLGMAAYYFKLDEPQNAFRFAVLHLKNNPDDPSGRRLAGLSLARSLSNIALYELANFGDDIVIDVLMAAMEENEEDARILVPLATRLLRSPRHAKDSCRVMQGLQTLYPNDPIVCKTLMVVYRDIGENEMADKMEVNLALCAQNPNLKSELPFNEDRLIEDINKAIELQAKRLVSKKIITPDEEEVMRLAVERDLATPEIYRKLALRAADRHEIGAEVLPLYERAVEENPELIALKHLLMQSYIAIGLYKRVFNHAMDMLLETPYQAMTLSLVIDCLLHEGAYDEDLHELLKTHYASRKTDEKTCVALALMYFRAEEYKEETLEVLEQALGFADEESKNLIQTALVRCYEELSQGEKATEIYQTILQSLPDDIVLIRRLARNTVRGGDTRPESNGVLLKALKDGPYDTDLYFELCNIYINRRVKPITQFLIDRILANDPQQTHRLLKLFEKAVRLGMAGTSMNIQLAEYYYLEGQKERALRLLNQISQPTSRQARNMIEVYNIMLADDPTDLEVRRRRGELHCVLGETLQAVEDLTIFWENEGRKRPLPDDFVTLMKRYIAENTVPHPPILILVAKSLYRAGQYQEAIDLCHAILSLQRNHAEARFYLACSYYQVGNLDESARFMNRCENNRELMNWMYRLACDLERVGDEDGALEIFNQVIAELPTFRDCADRIYHIERGTSLQQSREIQDDINFPPELEGQPRKRFHLINELGRSPIFMIYKAFDHDTDEIVSLKVMSEQFNKNREAVELFLLEAQRFKKLNHPHILKVREIGEDAPSPYLISNYVSQGNVANLLKHDSVSMAQRIRWVLQLAEAMAHAHDRSHVHGNLNLRNILIDYFGLVKVTDFGLGRLNRESKVISRQLAVQVPIYQAPEIFMGEPVSMATDMYSFGICAYEMITLTPPFVGGDLENRHLHEPPAPMPDTPTILSEVVLQCLNKQARSRPNDMHQVVKALQQVSFDVSKRISITNF